MKFDGVHVSVIYECCGFANRRRILRKSNSV